MNRGMLEPLTEDGRQIVEAFERVHAEQWKGCCQKCNRPVPANGWCCGIKQGFETTYSPEFEAWWAGAFDDADLDSKAMMSIAFEESRLIEREACLRDVESEPELPGEEGMDAVLELARKYRRRCSERRSRRPRQALRSASERRGAK